MMQSSVADFDPFVVPETVAIGNVQPRQRAAVRGRVTSVLATRWAPATRALRVTIDDGSGALGITFLGRTAVPGVEVGREIVVGGTLAVRHNERMMLHPRVWLLAPDRVARQFESSVVAAAS